MTYHTPKEAAKYNCPIARTRPETNANGGVKAKCSGPDCILWRWKPRLASDPEFKAAIQRECAALAQEEGSGKAMISFLKKATANVAADPQGYGINPERGYCGLGGVPTS